MTHLTRGPSSSPPARCCHAEIEVLRTEHDMIDVLGTVTETAVAFLVAEQTLYQWIGISHLRPLVIDTQQDKDLLTVEDAFELIQQ